MNKNEILQYALPSYSQRDEVQIMVTANTPASVIEAKVTQVKKDLTRQTSGLARWKITQSVSMSLWLVTLIVAFGFLAFHPDTDSIDTVFWQIALGILLMGGANVAFSLQFQGTHEYNVRYCMALLNQLEPIAGTNTCQEALSYLESNAPGVASWRDIALAERGQLYQFDISIMRQLHLLEGNRLKREQDRQERMRLAVANAISRSEREHLNAQACRKVHGLAPLSVSEE